MAEGWQSQDGAFIMGSHTASARDRKRDSTMPTLDFIGRSACKEIARSIAGNSKADEGFPYNLMGLWEVVGTKSCLRRNHGVGVKKSNARLLA